MERLNRPQIETLRGVNPKAKRNKSKFFDHVSVVTIRGKLNKEKSNFLQEMTKLNINAKVRLVNA